MVAPGLTKVYDQMVERAKDNPQQLALQVAVVAGTLGVTYWTFFSRPTSYPGGPRANRQSRRGQWKARKTTLEPGWVFAHAEESHRVSEQYYESTVGRVPMTGEAAGRQMWYYDKNSKFPNDQLTFCAAENPNASDKPFRFQQIAKWKGPKPDPTFEPRSARDAAIKAMQYYQMIQCDDGHWAGDYGGPMFLMPGLIITCYITKTPLGQRKQAMIAYLCNHQQEDGGWGLHIEGPSTMFGTVMSYVSLRLLGLPADNPSVVEARQFIHRYGGAVMASSWCKFWLAVLGVYEWEGINSIPAEMWLLPRWLPFHPGRLWCHCRMVYLPMCYLYCKRYSVDATKDPLLLDIRKELYTQPYDKINWDGERHSISPLDEYDPVTLLQKTLHNILAFYERWPCKWLRDRGTQFAIDYIHAEDFQTNYVDIGPVNKALNMMCVYAQGGKDCEAFKRHVARIDDYLWVAEDGMKMQGYNGSQCWDTSFLVQAVVEGDLAAEFPEAMKKAYSYLDRTQIREDEVDREYWFRHISKGGWPFSTAAHGWPIADCTSEGLKGVLALMDQPLIRQSGSVIPDERIYQAVNVIISYQNTDGGWATYENNRGYGWYEYLNPSEVFGDIMIDYSYVELTSACMTALDKFQRHFPDHRSREIGRSIQRGKGFIKAIQRPDGSWYGSWGICFTYATWFGIEALVAAGEDPTKSKAIQKAVAFLLGKQNQNGGWGESYLSCVDKAYPVDGTGGAINRGVRYLLAKQKPDGDWDQEGITGVFNRSCGITYSQYRNIFPLWALGRYAAEYEK